MHLFAGARGMIVVPGQMQDAVNDIKDQFLIRQQAEVPRPAGRGGGGDHDLAVQPGALPRLGPPGRRAEIKGQDIRGPVAVEIAFVQTPDL